MNYKSIVTIALMSISLSVYSQDKKVGIDTDEPTQALDVNGDLKVRKIDKIGSSRSLVADKDGVLGYYKDFTLRNIESQIAIEPLDIEVNGRETKNNQPLKLETTLTIPANTVAKVIIEYSVPVGIVVDENEENLTKEFADYAGVRFMKKEEGKTEEAFGGSRKYTVDDWVDSEYGTVVTVTNKYVEEFEAKPKDRVITYSLNAYIEHNNRSGAKRHYRFNMYSSTPGENRNWGKGIMTQKVYFR